MGNQIIARTGMGLSGVSHAILDRLALVGSNDSEMNACVATCDRWADGSRIGLEWTGRDRGTIVRTYDALRADAARCNGGRTPGTGVVCSGK